MAANVKMLAGSDAELKAVDFADGMDVEVFEKQLAEAIDSYADCEAVLVLADIAGGTPYNRAAGLSMTRPKVRVISGLNSSMLMDLCMRNITGDECPDGRRHYADRARKHRQVCAGGSRPAAGGRGRYLKGETP